MGKAEPQTADGLSRFEYVRPQDFGSLVSAAHDLTALRISQPGYHAWISSISADGVIALFRDVRGSLQNMSQEFEMMVLLRPHLEVVRYQVDWDRLAEVLAPLHDAINGADGLIQRVQECASALRPDGSGFDFLKMLFEDISNAPQVLEDLRGVLYDSLRFLVKYGAVDSISTEDIRSGVEHLNKLKLLLNTIHDPSDDTVISKL